MSMKQVLWRGAICGVLVLMVALMVGGCEKAEGQLGLTLDPASVRMGPDEHSVAITVVGETANEPLALPLEWRVSDPGLGTIEHSEGVTAIYRKTGQLGLNTVTARDQFKNEGFSVIEQVGATYAIALTANPESPIAMGTATMISITPSEGIEPPYTWHKLSGPGAVSAGSGSASAVYSSSTPGIGVIRVTDGNGMQGVISIVVEDPNATYAIALTANPESPIATGTATTISITANDGVKPPYTWEKLSGPGVVSAGSGSASAVYSSSTPGIGVIRVRDGNGVQGVISIVVEDSNATYAIVLRATPESPIASGTATTISITPTPGLSAPYTWEHVSGPGAVSAGTGSTSAVYSSSTPGVGVIRVTDGNGVQGVISIVVSEPTGGGPGDP